MQVDEQLSHQLSAPSTPIVFADDLSGAAEVAAVALRVGWAAAQVLLNAEGCPGDGQTLPVVDLNSRCLDAASARTRVEAMVRSLTPGNAPLAKKIDSLLRGNLEAELDPFLRHGFTVVLSPALPRLGRTVLDGVLLLNRVPLHETDAWFAEGCRAPHTVREALGGIKSLSMSLDDLRSGALSDVVRSSPPCVVVCDAVDDADLQIIANAAHQHDVVLAGSSDLIGHLLARSRPAPGPTMPVAMRARPGPAHRVLGVVGTAAPIATRQLADAAAMTGVLVRRLDMKDLVVADGRFLARASQDLAAALLERNVCLAVGGVFRLGRVEQRRVTESLAEIVTGAVARDASIALFLTGGETARAVLDRLTETTLHVFGEVHHGAVVARTRAGRLVSIRPGSFGDETSITQVFRALGSERTIHERPKMTTTSVQKVAITEAGADTRPIIAVTMGDAAGVGPEVLVGALADPEVLSLCRPLAVGDLARLKEAARILGLTVDIVAVEGVDDSIFEVGRINVIDLGLIPPDLPWGELSALAGDAAYQYIKVASDLAVAGAVQGICTAPLNKEALYLGGHKFPGHTELLAHLTGTPEVSMMLSSPQLKVIHVTTHIGLIDAVAKIEPGLVERTVRRGNEALVRAGIPAPRIGVCAINPHAGEHGLFGRGEEEEKIVPAIEILQADGLDVTGPLPADTAFFLAGRGDYDLIVAMYHDQGHGPIKVMGIEDGVNITVGLPVIRTSVDHGTAFDIAGTGKVKMGSMIEAMRQAAALSAVVK